MTYYKAALDYIYSFTDYEKLPAQAFAAANFDLRRVEELLERLESPHLGPRTVHIAGTKGKGSTAAMVASALTAAGYRTGLYTSPHLHTFRERIRVDGELITEETVAPLTERMKPAVEAVNQNHGWGRLTSFELMVALAFCYFQERQVDFQVLEVGLGGRLDATNVVPAPDVCVITPISLDHTQILGNTIPQIAAEKVAIIKSGSTAVAAPQPPEAWPVIRGRCLAEKVPLIEVGRDILWERTEASLKGQSYRLKSASGGAWHFNIPLLGEHQGENLATAIATLEALEGREVEIPWDAVAKGVAEVKWPGRMQILEEAPLFLVDGAHNPASAGRLRKALEQDIDFRNLIIIIGTSSDKDIQGIVAELAPEVHLAIATKTKNPRAADPDLLADEFTRRGVRAEVARDVPEAVTRAKAHAATHDLICATGSLFLVAEVIEWVTRLRNPDAFSNHHGSP